MKIDSLDIEVDSKNCEHHFRAVNERYPEAEKITAFGADSYFIPPKWVYVVTMPSGERIQVKVRVRTSVDETCELLESLSG